MKLACVPLKNFPNGIKNAFYQPQVFAEDLCHTQKDGLLNQISLWDLIKLILAPLFKEMVDVWICEPRIMWVLVPLKYWLKTPHLPPPESALPKPDDKTPKLQRADKAALLFCHTARRPK